MTRAIAFVPARAGSQRVKLKNIRPLAGHPLMAYAITSALTSGVFERVVVSTDSPEIAEVARHYGADVPFLRPAEFATTTSPDIEWLKYTLERLTGYDAFAILRPTSPFRTVETIRRAWDQFNATRGIDSLRAVELCHEHPGKMWTIGEDRLMTPFVPQDHLEVPYHARQYQDLPRIYIQNSSLEMAWVRVVFEHNSREGRVIAPFLTTGTEGFSIDYEKDWLLAEAMIERGLAAPVAIDVPPFAAIPAAQGN